MNTKITREQFNLAQSSAKILKDAIQSLEKLDKNVLGDSIRNMPEIEDCLTLLRENATVTDAIFNKALDQYENRNKQLLNAASTRFFKIDSEIEAAERNQYFLRSSYLIKLADLRSKNFADDEISKIITNPAQEIEALKTSIDSLRLEKEKIQTFLADGPAFDEAILEDTQVYQTLEIQQNKITGIPSFATKTWRSKSL